MLHEVKKEKEGGVKLTTKVGAMETKRPAYFGTLQKRAEEFINKHPSAVKKIPPRDVQNLIEDLQIHQIELEMQNEELRRAQLEIEASSDKYTDLYDFAPVGYFTVNEKGIILELNLTGASMLGFERRNLIGNYLSEFITKDTADVFYLGINNLLKERLLQTIELRLVKKGGTEFHAQLECAISAKTGDNFNNIQIVVSDISARKLAEEALRESEEKYRTILESIEEGYYEVDLTGNFTFVNDAMCTLRGQSRDELIGKNNKDYMNPDTAKTVYKYFNKVYDTGTPAKNVGWRTIRADGNERYVESSIGLLKNSKDQPIGFRGVVRDVTERKRMEDELRQARKMESIGTMAGGIAHDFNNLLYMITGNTELALEDTPEWNPVHANLQEIKSAGLRAAGIVKQLLNFSRKTDQELKHIGAITVIKDALKFMRSMIPKAIEIRKHLPDTDVTILADPIQINQVMMNICTNASQAMEETGGILEITVENATLSEEEVANYPDLTAGDHVKITVSDTGPGIGPEIINRIFDPYFTTKGFGEGSGMGLTVVHGIMKNHSGAIAVDSQPDKGATFTILFPVVAEKPVMEIKTPDATPRGNETILRKVLDKGKEK